MKFCIYAQELHWFVQKVSSEFNEVYMCLVCKMMNWKEISPSDCEVRTVVHFLIIENNSSAEIHHCSCNTYRKENVINLKNVQRWQLMFGDETTSTHDDECEG